MPQATLPTFVEGNGSGSAGLVNDQRRSLGTRTVSQRSWRTNDPLRLRIHSSKTCPYSCKHCPVLLSKRVSPHWLRHSCAMRILQATKDLRKVSLWLGHASVQSTEIYTRADP